MSIVDEMISIVEEHKAMNNVKCSLKLRKGKIQRCEAHFAHKRALQEVLATTPPEGMRAAGAAFHKAGKSINVEVTMPADFVNGYLEEEKNSHCGFNRAPWAKTSDI